MAPSFSRFRPLVKGPNGQLDGAAKSPHIAGLTFETLQKRGRA